jgi:hypothetical protein
VTEPARDGSGSAAPDPAHAPGPFALLRLWRSASRSERLATFLPPLFLPPALLFGADLSIWLAGPVLLVAALLAAVRLLSWPMRRGRPARLVRWRLPLTILAGLLMIRVSAWSFTTASLDAAAEAQNWASDGPWVCGEAATCHRELGLRIAPVRVHFERLECREGGSGRIAMLGFGPDFRLRIQHGRGGVLEAFEDPRTSCSGSPESSPHRSLQMTDLPNLVGISMAPWPTTP